MASFEARHDTASRGMQAHLESAIDATVRSVAAFIRVESNSINIRPVLDRNSRDELAQFEDKRVAFDVPITSNAPNLGENSVVSLQQYSIHKLPMPDYDPGDTIRYVDEHAVGHAAGTAALLS